MRADARPRLSRESLFFRFGQALVDPLLQQTSVFGFLEQAQTVPDDFARRPVAPGGHQRVDERALVRRYGDISSLSIGHALRVARGTICVNIRHKQPATGSVSAVPASTP